MFRYNGLLNLPALFALADFRVLSVIYAVLSCTEIVSFAGYSAPRVHQHNRFLHYDAKPLLAQACFMTSNRRTRLGQYY